MEERKSFILYSSSKDLIDELSNEQAGALLKSIFEYVTCNELPEMDGMTRIVFKTIKSYLDKDFGSYQAKCEINKKNGALGGRPRNEIPVTEPEQEESRNIPEKKKKPVRHHYGIYKNVLLSDEDLETLKAEFPSNWEEWINKVDAYVQSHGKKYTDYLATIRNWARDEKPKTNTAERNKFDDPRQRENYGFIDEQLLPIVQG